MLKVHFIKIFFLLKNVFWTSHILTLWSPVSLARGPQCSAARAGRARHDRRRQAQAGRPGGGAPGRGRAWGFGAAGEAVAVAVAKPVLPTPVFPQHSWFLGGSAWQKQTQRGRRGLTEGLHRWRTEREQRQKGNRKQNGRLPTAPRASSHLSATCPGRHGTTLLCHLGSALKSLQRLFHWPRLCLHCSLRPLVPAPAP